MTKTKKIRKNVNVSIQSKQYNESINEILNDWEDEGLNISTKVCDSILLANKIEQSPTLLSVLNIYDLAIKLFNLYQLDESSLEEALSELITINATGLTDVIGNKYNGTIAKKQTQKTVKANRVETVKEEVVVENANHTKTQVEDNNEDTIAISSDEGFEYVEADNEYAIPEDILFNS